MKKWYEGNTGTHQGLVIDEQTGESIAVTYKKENAALVSAAPELLEGLKMILDLSEKATPEARHGSFLGDIGRIAESLIYKAENKGK